MKCPKCNGNIKYIDTYDTSTFNEFYIEYCIGKCKECNTQYQWEESYKYIGVNNLKES